MKTAIKIERTAKGKVRKITITPSSENPLDDLLDSIVYEAQKNEPTIPLEDVLKELDTLHKLEK